MATPRAQWQLPRLRVTRDGEWFDGDVEITHPGVLRNLRSALRRDGQGYFIQTRMRIPVDVEDVPLVVARVEARDAALHAVLNDGTEVDIDPATVRIGAANVPYAAVANGFEARLSRAATFQLLALVERDERSGQETLRVGGRAYPLGRRA